MEGEMVTVTEAARILGTNKEKIARLVKAGILTARASTIDARRRLIPRAQLERILAEEGRLVASSNENDPHPLPRSIGIYTGPVKVHGRDVDEYLRVYWNPE